MDEGFDLSGDPHRIALVDATRSIDRGELKAAVDAIAGNLRKHGAGPGTLVAVPATTDISTVIALLAARTTGATACSMDPTQMATRLPRLKPRIVIVKNPDAPFSLQIESVASEDATPSLANGAWGIQTSGSTGEPKTVILAARGVADIAEWSASELYLPTDRVCSMLPLHHILGLTQVWCCLRVRATLVLSAPLPPGEFVDWARDATLLPAIPLFVRWLKTANPKPPLRIVTLGGQSTMPEERIAFTAAFPHTKFYNMYGLTEATRALWLHPDEFTTEPLASGRPVPHLRASLDADGELTLKGSHVAEGYLDPIATRERFPQPNVLRTGDLFSAKGDLFTYLGRKDTVFKSFGEKVIPEQVERELGTHPAVGACLVTGLRTTGPELRPVAHVVLIKGAPAPTPESLMEYLGSRLPVLMVPRQFHFVDELPRTASGKIRRIAPKKEEP